MLPAPCRVLENGHVGAALLEVTKTPLDGGGHHDEVVALLRAIERVDQLPQQTAVGALLRAYRVRREMRSANLYLDGIGSPCRRRQPEHG